MLSHAALSSNPSTFCFVTSGNSPHSSSFALQASIPLQELTSQTHESASTSKATATTTSALALRIHLQSILSCFVDDLLLAASSRDVTALLIKQLACLSHRHAHEFVLTATTGRSTTEHLERLHGSASTQCIGRVSLTAASRVVDLLVRIDHLRLIDVLILELLLLAVHVGHGVSVGAGIRT